MISVSEYIASNNPEGGMRIIKKYGIQPPANAHQMVHALNHIGRNHPESKKDFVHEHPDHKAFYSFYGQHYNVEGTIAQTPEQETIVTPMSFYKQHESVLMIAGAILIAALILKK